jgi:hypothetical protein
MPAPSPLDVADKGLKATETLISLLKDLVTAVVPNLPAAASDLESVCNKLLDANENVVRWIGRFRDFDFGAPDAAGRFGTLASEYQAMKVGRRYQELKFSCGEIGTIYYTRLAGKLKGLFGGAKADRAQEVFEELSDADANLVTFVHEVIFKRLDDACDAIDKAVDAKDFAAAEQARLEFKVASKELVNRLQAVGDGLAELVLDMKRVAAGTRP